MSAITNVWKSQTWMDIHTHIGTGSSPWWRKLGWPDPTVATAVRHILHDHIDELWAIVDNHKKFESLRRCAPVTCNLKCFYWMHDVQNPDTILLGRLAKAGLVHGIKLHSQIDNFPMTDEALRRVTRIARKLHLPIIFHSASCGRESHGPEKEMRDMYLTSPDKYERLIWLNPDIPFVIGHGGAYAMTRLGPTTPPGRAFWDEEKRPYSIRFLIQEALRIATSHANAFYDTSVATNPGKAELIADWVNDHPKAAHKVLVGTDHPIQWSRCPTQVAALLKKGLHPSLALVIARNRFSKMI